MQLLNYSYLHNYYYVLCIHRIIIIHTYIDDDKNSY